MTGELARRVIAGTVERATGAEVEPRTRAPVVRGRPPRRPPARHQWPGSDGPRVPPERRACDVWRVGGACSALSDVRLEVVSDATPGLWDLCERHGRALWQEAEARQVTVHLVDWFTRHAPPGRYEGTPRDPYRRLQYAPEPRSDYVPTRTGPVNGTLSISGEPRPERAVTFLGRAS